MDDGNNDVVFVFSEKSCGGEVNNSIIIIYAITPALLNNLGIGKKEEMPDFGDIMNALDTFEQGESQITGEVIR